MSTVVIEKSTRSNAHDSSDNMTLSSKPHAVYMRQWRKSHPLTAEQRRKDSARSYLSVYLKRGKVVKLPCRICGSKDVQAYREDYSKPLLVDWLCRKHHKALHVSRGT